MKILKRNGLLEQYDINKIHKVLEWATEGIDDVSISEIEMKSNLEIQEGTSTKQIHDILISTSSKLISEEYPNYQYVAARLALFQLRKEVYNQFEPTSLDVILQNNILIGKYDPEILKEYNNEEILYFNSIIDHNRDFKFTYIGIHQLIQKYLVKDRTTKKIYETPQIAFMLIAMCSFIKYEKNVRKKYVKDFYEMLSNLEISLPTPIMAGLRTSIKQFSSCVLIDCDDSLDSIVSTNGAIIKYAANKAGLGINVGRIRSLGSSVRNGEVSHTGLVPFIQMFEKTVHSVSQGGVRKGSATLFFPVWHLEIESLIVLKNNKGTEDNRCVSGNSKIEIEYNGIKSIICIENLQYYLDNYKNVKVLSFNEKNKEKEFKSIIGFQKTKTNAKVLKIEYNGKELICTPDHRIYTHNRGYVEAQDLVESDILEIN